MGKLLFGNKEIVSVFAGAQTTPKEVVKIYYGTTLIWEKNTGPITATAHLMTPMLLGEQNPNNCTLNQSFPYTFTDTTTIRVTPTSISNGQWSIRYKYAVYDANSSLTGNEYSLTVTSDLNNAYNEVTFNATSPSITDYYFWFNHNKGSIVNSTFTVSSAFSSATNSIDLSDNSGGVGITFPTTTGIRPQIIGISGRKVRIEGWLGTSTTNLETSENHFDSTIICSPTSSLPSRWVTKTISTRKYVTLQCRTQDVALNVTTISLTAQGKKVNGAVKINKIEIF